MRLCERYKREHLEKRKISVEEIAVLAKVGGADLVSDRCCRRALSMKVFFHGESSTTKATTSVLQD